MLKKLRRYRDTFRHEPTDSDPYNCMPPKPFASAPQTATSRTLYYAQQSSSLIPSARKPLPSRSESGTRCPAPDSSAARYWAARAVTAEVLLAERSKHAHELRGVIYEEDVKRKVPSHLVFAVALF